MFESEEKKDKEKKDRVFDRELQDPYVKRKTARRKDGSLLLLHEIRSAVAVDNNGNVTQEIGIQETLGQLDDNSVYDPSMPVKACNNGHIVQHTVECPHCGKHMCLAPGCVSKTRSYLGIICPFCESNFELSEQKSIISGGQNEWK